MEGTSAREGVNETERRKKEARSLAMSNLSRPRCQRYGDGACEVATLFGQRSLELMGLRLGSRRRRERPSFIVITKHHFCVYATMTLLLMTYAYVTLRCFPIVFLHKRAKPLCLRRLQRLAHCAALKLK